MWLPLCLKNFAGKIFQTKKKRNLFFTTLLRKEQAAEAAVSGNSARIPKGESKGEKGEAGILAHCLFYAGSAAVSLAAFAAPPFSLRTSLASAEAIRTSSSAEDTPSASIGSSFSDSA